MEEIDVDTFETIIAWVIAILFTILGLAGIIACIIAAIACPCAECIFSGIVVIIWILALLAGLMIIIFG